MNRGPLSALGRNWRLQALVCLALLTGLYAPGLTGGHILHFRDNLSHHVGWRLAWSAALANGAVPLLDDTIVAGAPFLADPNTMALYPLNLPFLVLPPAPALALFYLAHQLLLGLGAFLLLVRLGHARRPALAGALVMAGGGLAFSQLAFTNAAAALAWAPWLIRTAVRPPQAPAALRRRIAAAGALGAVGWLAGEPVISALAWLLWGAALICQAPMRRHALRTAAFLLAAPALSVLLAAPLIAPAFPAWAESRRQVLGLAPGSVAADAFAPRRWPELLLPHLYGRPGPFAPDGFWARPSFPWLRYEVNLHLGPIALVLLLLGLGARRGAVWKAVVVAATALAAAPAVIQVAAQVVPPLAGFRYAIKILLLALLAAGPVVARGFVRAAAAPRRFRLRSALVAVLLVCALPLTAPKTARRALGAVLPSSAANLALPGVSDRVAGSVRGDLLAGLLPLVAAVVAPRALLIPALAAQLAAGGASMLMWDDAARYARPPRLLAEIGPAPRLLDTVAFDFRTLHTTGAAGVSAPARRTRLGFAQLWQYYGAPFGVRYRGVTGADGMEPWRVADCARRLTSLPPDRLGRAARHLGADTVLTRAPLPAGPDIAGAWTTDIEGEPVAVNRLAGPTPPAWLARREVHTQSRAGGWRLIGSPGVEPGSDAVTLAAVPGVLHYAGGSVRVLDRGNGSWRLEIRSAGDGLLVVDQAFTRSWRASVDEERAPIVPVNLWQLGVRVPPGAHTVRLDVDRRPDAQAGRPAPVVISEALVAVDRHVHRVVARGQVERGVVAADLTLALEHALPEPVELGIVAADQRTVRCMPGHAEDKIGLRAANAIADVDRAIGARRNNTEGNAGAGERDLQNLHITGSPARPLLDHPHPVEPVDPGLLPARDIAPVPRHHGIRGALGDHRSRPQVDGPVAERCHHVEVVGNQDQRDALASHPRDAVQATARERSVADRQHLVDEQDVGVDGDRDGKAEADVHPRRVGLDRLVDELADAREFEDLVHPALDLRPGEPEQHAVDDDVLAPGDLGVKARAQLDQCRHPPADLHAPLSRPEDPADHLERSGLPRSVGPDQRHGLAGRHRQVEVVERGEPLARPQAAQQVSVQQRTLETVQPALSPEPAVNLAHAVEDDAAFHTASTSESRNRRNSHDPASQATRPTPRAVAHASGCGTVPANARSR